MFHQTLERVINTLKVKFVNIQYKKVLKPVQILKEKSPHHKLIISHKGRIQIEVTGKIFTIRPSQLFFLPADTVANITYGHNPIAQIDLKDTDKDINNYIESAVPEELPQLTDSFSVIDFDIKAYNAIDFFKFVELPPFEIESNNLMDTAVNNILKESNSNELGSHNLLNSNMMLLVIMLIRYIVEQKLFLQKISSRINALMDNRLIHIFSYISNNLKGNLSNEAIGNLVGVSREYIGQLFKHTTHMNLQEYVKIVRISKATELLMTTNKKVQEVARECGIEDDAYFCRIFKKLLGLTANQFKKRHQKTR